MKLQSNFCIALLAFGSIAVTAQTSNYGEFTVTENTIFSNEDTFTNTATATVINDGDTYLYGDLVNNGQLDFIGPNGIVNFVGNAPQDIQGAAPCYFNTITFNNTAQGIENISLNNTLYISNIADFTDGILNIDAHSGEVIFENNAIAVNANNDSFIDGSVHKRGDNEFNFPVGDGIYHRELLISGPVSDEAEITAKYHFEDPGALYSRESKRGIIEVVNDSEYWVVENTTGNEEVFITLSWQEGVTSAEILKGSKSAIHVVRWNPIDQLWEHEGGASDDINNRVTTISTVADYGVFTLGRVKEEELLPTGKAVYNAISTNNDGKNDFFNIIDIEDYPNNTVEIFNRWGVKLYSTTNYGSNGNVFKGRRQIGSNGGNRYLPTGTYFYVIRYDFEQDGVRSRTKKAGFLYINSD